MLWFVNDQLVFRYSLHILIRPIKICSPCAVEVWAIFFFHLAKTATLLSFAKENIVTLCKFVVLHVLILNIKSIVKRLHYKYKVLQLLWDPCYELLQEAAPSALLSVVWHPQTLDDMVCSYIVTSELEWKVAYLLILLTALPLTSIISDWVWFIFISIRPRENTRG